MFRRGYRGSTYNLYIGTSLIAVGIACTLLTWLMTGAIVLDWVAWVA